ncbi:MAG: formylmethanofuran dehydrogenase subunit B, partial [Candidatus Hecatellaceae archaeon]
MPVVRGVVCTFCGCVCDDLEATVEDGQVKDVKYACAIGREKMLNCVRERDPRILVRKNGELREASLEEALNRAAEILANAKYPLLYGWSNTGCEAVKLGVELAEELGGVIDNTACVCHGPGLEAVHEVGVVEGTLGQARHRADLIVYWGCNPSQAHMRHMARYTVMSKGLFRDGRKDRKLVVVDVRKTMTARLADIFIQVEPGGDYELLQALRMAIRDEEIEAEKVAGVPVEQIEELADLMVGCQFGFLFFGLGLTQSSAKNENVAAAIELIRDLNFKTKWLIIPMRGHHNVTGANKVLLWETGYPFAVDFSHGYPRYNPGETTAADLLARGEVDAAL